MATSKKVNRVEIHALKEGESIRTVILNRFSYFDKRMTFYVTDDTKQLLSDIALIHATITVTPSGAKLLQFPTFAYLLRIVCESYREKVVKEFLEKEKEVSHA